MAVVVGGQDTIVITDPVVEKNVNIMAAVVVIDEGAIHFMVQIVTEKEAVTLVVSE